jgi:heme-degrading monooxygenase HmoA
MILAVSRFKVMNGREVDVKEAFFNRRIWWTMCRVFWEWKHFTETENKVAFYLITRWTDQDSFRRWHSSPAHHQSHRGMPKGLRLDPAFTRIFVLERLTDAARPRSMSEIVVDSEALMRDVITESDLLHLLVGDLNGNIKFCNKAVARSLGLTCDKLLDQPLATYLLESGAARFAELIANSIRDFKSTFLLNFVNSMNEPYTLVCRIDVQPSHFILVGEPRIAEELGFQNELNELNNQLATLARENARKTKERVRFDKNRLGGLRPAWPLLITIYVTHCLVYCRRVYRRADCKCDNAHSLGLGGNHIVRHRGFRGRRFDCATVLKTTGGAKFHPAGFLMSIIGAIILVFLAKLIS